MTPLELGAHLYERRDADAVQHLFRVAASLDSLVLGEPQILGQTKRWRIETARRAGSAGPVLNACFQSAFRVARRVRRETEIARNPVSISSVAIELARQVFGGFAGREVLVVGAVPKMSRAGGDSTLHAHGATLTVTNRTRARADELGVRFGASVRDWSDLAGALGAADIVIASTGAQRPVLTAGDAEASSSGPRAAACSSCSTSRCRATWSPRRGSSTASTWPTSTTCRRWPPSTATSVKTKRGVPEAIIAQEVLESIPQGPGGGGSWRRR